MLLKYFYDPQILQRLVILYFHPCTVNNDSLRQCLSYFLPAFSYSSIENQEFMTSILGVCIRKLIKQYYKNKSKDEMISPIQIGQQMIDWTDYRRVLSNDFYKAKSCPHARLAIKFLKIAEKDNITVIKTMCYLLNKLTLNDSIENLVINDILERSENLKEMANNKTVTNLLSKFIYYVKNVKIKIEDEDKSNIKDIKVEIKEEINSPDSKSHYIIKKDEISDEEDEKENIEKLKNDNLISDLNNQDNNTDMDITEKAEKDDDNILNSNLENNEKNTNNDETVDINLIDDEITNDNINNS